MENLKEKILEKKELKGLSSEFLDVFLNEYKLKNQKLFKTLEEKKFNEKSKEFDELKKAIRKKLREVHGVFTKDSIGPDKKEKFISELKKAKKDEELEIIETILKSHRSTLERIKNYSNLYSQIFDERTKKILDLGCGYNPFSIEYIKTPVEYICFDINKDETDFIQKYFNLKKIKGTAEVIDLTDEKNMKRIEFESKTSDVCLMFKLLDSLESKKRGSSKILINNIKSKKLIISFPLKTIGGRKEIKGKRKWFDKILEEQKRSVKELIIDNEHYYILD
ncbi:MAG: hypothetical protein WC758_05320 [Candidatus Woesearchaeota archaeon]|jgi:16S rRNA (guanine(1405)-N(7))-methyltransferase